MHIICSRHIHHIHATLIHTIFTRHYCTRHVHDIHTTLMSRHIREINLHDIDVHDINVHDIIVHDITVHDITVQDMHTTLMSRHITVHDITVHDMYGQTPCIRDGGLTDKQLINLISPCPFSLRILSLPAFCSTKRLSFYSGTSGDNNTQRLEGLTVFP